MLVRVLKSVYGSQLGQPHYHLGFAHAIVYGQATPSYIIHTFSKMEILFQLYSRPTFKSSNKNISDSSKQ